MRSLVPIQTILLLLSVSAFAGLSVADEGPALVVSVDTAQIKVTDSSGVSEIIARPKRGTRLWALRQKDSFHRVIDPVSKRPGWIWSKHVQPVQPADTARQKFEKALRAVDQLPDVIHDDSQRGELLEARKRVLKASLDAFGEIDPRTATAYYFLGDVQIDIGDLDEAQRSANKSLELFAKLRGETSVDVANSHKMLAKISNANRDFDGAIRQLRPALGIMKEKMPDSIDTARLLNDMAIAHEFLEHWKEAENYYQQAIRTVAKLREPFPADHYTIATNLVAMQQARGELEQAKQVLSRLVLELGMSGKVGKRQFADAMNYIGVINHDLQNFEQAESNYRKAIEVLDQCDNVEPVDRLVMRENLASLLLDHSQPDKAISLLESCLQQRQQLEGPKAISVANVLQQLGRAHFDKLDYAQAEKRYRAAIDILRPQVDTMNIDLLNIQSFLGSLLYTDSRSAEAVELGRKVLDDYSKSGTKDDSLIIWHKQNLARALRDLGTYEESEALHREVVQYCLDQLGPEHSETITARRDLAFLYQDLGRYSESLEILQRNLAICRETFDEKDMATVNATRDVGWANHLNGDYSDADPLLNRALQQTIELTGSDSVETAAIKLEYGDLLRVICDYSRAEQFLKDAYTINQRVLGASHFDTLRSMENLAALQRELGAYQQAEKLWLDVLRQRTEVYGDTHPLIADVHFSLGSTYEDLEQFAKARQHYGKSLKIRSELFGPDSPEASVSMHDLGWLRLREGELEEAESLLTQSLQISDEHFGRKSESSALTLRLVGKLRLAQNRLDAAEQAFSQCLTTLKDIYPSNHPRVAQVLSNLAHVHFCQGNVSATIRRQDEAAQINRRHLASVLPGLSESARQRYLAESHQVNFEKALSLGWQFRDNPRAAIFSAGWLLNGKSAGSEAMAEAALLSTPQATEYVRELRTVRNRISALTLKRHGEIDDITRQNLAALESKQQTLPTEDFGVCPAQA